MRKFYFTVCIIFFFTIPAVLLAPEPNRRNPYDGVLDSIKPKSPADVKKSLEDLIRDIRFQVYVSVTSENKKAFIESHIKRELRALHDVNIASRDKATYFIDIVSLENINRISVAYCSYKRVPIPEVLKAPKPDFLTDKDYKDVWKFRNKLYSFSEPHLGVISYPIKDLDEACKSIVAKFDQALLESQRESNQELLEMLK